MKLSTRLLLAALVPLVVALIAVASFVASYQSVFGLQQEQARVVRMRTRLIDLNDFARSYVLYGDARSRRQFLAVAEQASLEASESANRLHEHRSEFRNLLRDVTLATSLFSRIPAGRPAAADSTGVTRQARERLSAQVFIRLRDANGIVGRLMQTVSDEIVARERQHSFLVGLATVAAAMFLTGALLQTRRTTLDSLVLLESGTRRVGSGDLEHRIGLTSTDELGQLGRSFDKMTAQLRELTVSRDELEVEIRERRRAEGLLARTLDTEKETSAYAEALNRINEAVHSSLEIDEIMGRVVCEIRRAVDADGAAVQVHRDGHWDFAFEDGLPERVGNARIADEDMPISTAALEARRPVMVNEVGENAVRSPFMQRHDIVSMMAVPLVVRDKVFGLLVAERFREHGPFTSLQLDFLQKCAATIDLALENARLYQTEHMIADRLQEALIALPSHVDGLEYDSVYRSASDVARVGGDFFDIFELPEGLVGLTIGDVAGKGLDASVLTSLVKNTIRAHAAERLRGPAEVLALTNRVVFETTSAEMFVTVFFGVLETATGRLAYASAGHTSTALVGEGQVLSLTSTGPILGAFGNAVFEQAEDESCRRPSAADVHRRRHRGETERRALW